MKLTMRPWSSLPTLTGVPLVPTAPQLKWASSRSSGSMQIAFAAGIVRWMPYPPRSLVTVVWFCAPNLNSTVTPGTGEPSLVTKPQTLYPPARHMACGEDAAVVVGFLSEVGDAGVRRAVPEVGEGRPVVVGARCSRVLDLGVVTTDVVDMREDLRAK